MLEGRLEIGPVSEGVSVSASPDLPVAALGTERNVTQLWQINI